MRIALCQLNLMVADIKGNCARIISAITEAKARQADIAVFSEQAICAYPAEDLLYRADFIEQCELALNQIAVHAEGIAVLMAHPLREQGKLYNACSWLENGRVKAIYRKQKLPNYLVFDEQRYFTAGGESVVVDFKGVRIGLLICEDLWHEAPMRAAKAAGAQLILSPNGSPWHVQQAQERTAVLLARAQENALPIVYVNQIGGQDDLIFDGRSQAWNSDGCTLMCAPFAEDLRCVDFRDGRLWPQDIGASDCTNEAEIYQALVLSVRDYVRKNGFKGTLLGLSGGIDSALTLAIAVDAIGKKNVRAVMMPYHYTADISVVDAQAQAQTMGVQFDNVSIAPMVAAFNQQLQPLFESSKIEVKSGSVDVTEQNLQARARGSLLMALSNKSGYLVLTTGNKSEVSVGYCTLYGDMAGGFDVLKDVPKMLVYRLAEFRNSLAPVIPVRVLERPPSAELAPDQKDEDNLPPYPLLDKILEMYVEQDAGFAQIVATGIAPDIVRKVLRLVERNEYKRRQAAPGPRISKRAFGRDRRYPITSAFVNSLEN